MESFYKTHKLLISSVQFPVRRLLMDEIDWSKRLIGIKGSRGVGKTTFLLQYAKERFGNDRRCLYVNFNNLYFSDHTLLEFAQQFYNQGGRTLLLDQTFKYVNWSVELRECYDTMPDLQIIFSGSSVMRLLDENDDIKDVVAVYNLRGFSFREYINLKTGLQLPSYSLDNIIDNQDKIAADILKSVDPMPYLSGYLEHGYYPFFLEKRNFSENLLKTINMMLEVDILLIKQIELKYLPKIRKLLYLIMKNAPGHANISQLATEIQTSRATIMNYIKYLKDARLLNTLYAEGEDYPKKPKLVYVHNTNLMYAVNKEGVDRQAVMKTFIYNMIHANHKVNLSTGNSDFSVDSRIQFKCDTHSHHRHNARHYFVVDAPTVEHKHEVPAWLMGFLY